MAKAIKAIAKPTQKTSVAKLSSKDFTVNPQTGGVHVSQAKLASLVQANLDKVKSAGDTKAIKISVGIDF